MFSVSYLSFSALLARFFLSPIKSKPGGQLNFHKFIQICALALDCVTRQLGQVNKK